MTGNTLVTLALVAAKLVSFGRGVCVCVINSLFITIVGARWVDDIAAVDQSLP